MKMRYMNWAAAGVWIVSSCLVSFVISFLKMKKIKYNTNQLDTFLKSPLTNGQILASQIISSFILGFIQLIFSILISLFLLNETLTFVQFILLFLQLFPLILFFSILGTLLGLYVYKDFLLLMIVVFIFMTLSFGLGSFIPLSYFPDGYMVFSSKIPLVRLIENSQFIIQNYPISFSYIFLTFLLNIFLGIILLVESYNRFRV